MADDANTPPVRGAVIDVHAHLLPGALLTGAPDQPDLPAHPRALADVEQRLRAMDRAGVDRQVVSPWIELVPTSVLVGERGRDWAEAHVRRVNDALAAEVARHPDRLVAMGALPQHEGDAAAGELERVVHERGMCGAMLTTSGCGRSLADPALDPLWAAAERDRALLMTHPRRAVEPGRAGEERTTDLVGTPLEGTLAVVGLLRAGVLDRFPALRLCVVHGGGALWALAGRIEALWDLSGGQAGRRPTDLLASLYVDTLTHDDRALALVADVIGPDHLLLGSDFPFATGDPDPVARVERLAAGSPGVRDAVLGGTLERLLDEVRRRS